MREHLFLSSWNRVISSCWRAPLEVPEAAIGVKLSNSENVGTPGSEHGLALLYTLSDWSGFVLAGNVKYIVQDGSSGFTSYAPATASSQLFSANITSGSPDPQTGANPNALAYWVHNPEDISAVPEFSTWLAGLFLLLPLGMSAFRILRGHREA